MREPASPILRRVYVAQTVLAIEELGWVVLGAVMAAAALSLTAIGVAGARDEQCVT